jgi:signal transduction histidine kinase/CheY-like chemotaxis protein/anti-sigma regulatory factor (Ser/Thr protein kinase)
MSVEDMAGRVDAHDWARHPWGAAGSWPARLRAAADLLLGSRFPMFLAWGADLRMLYNDAYAPMLGNRHPGALGEPLAQVWSDIWPVVAPLVEQVRGGEAVFVEDLLLMTERYGYPEETYFTFSYSPLGDDAPGLFCAVTETTGRVVGQRRLGALRELAAAAPVGASAEQVCRVAARVLDRHRADVPFATVHLRDADGAAALVATSGLAEGSALAPALVGPDTDELADVLRTGRSALVGDLVRRHAGAVLPGANAVGDADPQTVLVAPLAGPDERPVGVVVLAASPYLPLDEDYRGFLDLVTQQVARAVAEAAAFAAQQRRAEELAELDRAKTAFFTNISHEFRTPLTLMLGPVEELREHADGRLRAELDTVHRNGLRLGRLVSSLLDFSRLQAGRREVRYEPVDLAALTTGLAGVFRSAVERAGLRLDVDCPPLGEPVLIDPGMWEQVVLNLLSNAVKFTFEGGIAVTLRREGGSAVLRVRDTGTGVPPDEVPRLFERFHRVEGARSRSAEGSGIGLALVAELVDLHRGSIGAQSTLGVGTTFTVAVPLGDEHLPADQVAPGPRPAIDVDAAAEPFVTEALRWLSPGEPPAPGTAATSGRVLVVDDNADMRDHLVRVLSDRHAVRTAADGEAALAAVRTERPDLVVSDVMMPGLDGPALIAALRADPATAAVPVLLLSARAGLEATAEGLAAGADDYLVKPFSAAELRARVAGHLQLARLRRRALDRVRQLQEATAALSAAATPAEVAAVVVRRLGEMLGTPAVAVWQQHADDLLEQLDLGGWSPAIQADWVSLPVDGASPAGAAAVRREPVWVETEDDWLAHYPRLLPMVQGHGYPTIDCLPLLAGGACLGVVAVGFTAQRRLDDTERAAAVALVDQAAQALQRAALLAAESEARSAAEEFGRVVAALSGATSPAEVGAAVLAHTAELGAEAAVVVVRVAESAEHLRVLAASDPELVAARLPVEAAHPLAHAVRSGEPVWVGSRSRWAWRDREFAAGSSPLPGQLVLPLLVGGAAIGAIGMHFGAEIPVVDPARRATLLTIAGQCALALDRARLHQAEHDVAEALQRSLLPRELPALHRITSAAHYLPGADGVQAGGDWYDLLLVDGPDAPAGPDGQRVAMAVGDVVGQGPRAAAVMGQLRSALAGYLLDGHPPAAALERLDRFAARVPGAVGSTCACLVLDRATGELTWAAAGHLPALVVDAAGARFLDGGAGAVLGVRGRAPYAQATGRIDPGASVVLYTDGLVERRAEVLDTGLDRLRATADRSRGLPPDLLAEALLDELVRRDAPVDDTALVVVRLVPEALRLDLRADPAVLRELRHRVRDWAALAGLPNELGEDLEFVVGEAAANSIEHAGAHRFLTEVDLDVRRPGATVLVRDDGRWRPEPADPGHRGHGLRMMEQLADELDVRRGPGGTELRLRLPVPSAPAGPAAPAAPRDPTASATVRDRPGCAAVEGDLDHAGAADVRGPLLRRVAGDPGLTIDLIGVGYLGSAGVALLAEALATAPGVAVRATPGSAPARVLALAGLAGALRPATTGS